MNDIYSRIARSRIARLCPVIAIIAIIGMGIAGAAGNDDALKRRNAARHYYLTAAQYSARGMNAEAGELYKKAYQLDSTYAEAALQYGTRRWGMPVDTLSSPEEKGRSMRISRKFMERYPGDFFPNIFLSNVMERGNDFEGAISVLENIDSLDPGNSDVLMHLSELYLDTRQFEKALDAINSYERIEGEGLELLLRKAGMMLVMGDTVGAFAETERMMEKYPADLRYALFKGTLYNYINQPDSALKAFKYAESKEKPGFGGPVKIQLADYYRNTGDSVNYDKKMYEALMAEDLDFSVKNEVLAYYLQTLVNDNGDRTRGDRLFEVLREQYPHEPDLLALSARYQASKLDYVRAYEDIGYAIDMDHTRPEYWTQAMLYAIMQDSTGLADDVYRRALTSLDKVPLVLYSLAGNNATMNDQPDEALAIYQRALDENFPGQSIDAPADMQKLGTFLTYENIGSLTDIYTQIGDAYYKKGDRPKSYINYENALALDPDNGLTLNNYAYYLVEGSQPVTDEDLLKADQLSLRAINISPDNPTYLDTRAWVLFRKKEFDEARELEERAIEKLSPDADKEERAEYLHHLGDILFMLNLPEEAIEKWEEALEAAPKDALLKKKVKNRTFYYE